MTPAHCLPAIGHRSRQHRGSHRQRAPRTSVHDRHRRLRPLGHRPAHLPTGSRPVICAPDAQRRPGAPAGRCRPHYNRPAEHGGYVQPGTAARTRFAATRTLTLSAGNTLGTAGVLLGLVLWTWSLVWLWCPGGDIVRELFCEWHRRWQRCDSHNNASYRNTNGFIITLTSEFNIGWWSAILQQETMGLSSGRLVVEVPSAFLRVVGVFVSTLVFLLSLGIGALTLWDLGKTS